MPAPVLPWPLALAAVVLTALAYAAACAGLLARLEPDDVIRPVVAVSSSVIPLLLLVSFLAGRAATLLA